MIFLGPYPPGGGGGTSWGGGGGCPSVARLRFSDKKKVKIKKCKENSHKYVY